MGLTTAGLAAAQSGAPGAEVAGTDAAAGLRLVEAAKRADQEAALRLLDAGTDLDLDRRQSDGATALHWAVYHDDRALVDRLLAAGAAPGPANDHGVTPVQLACDNAAGPVVEALLGAGADADTAVRTGETPLMTCARTGTRDGVAALLEHGAAVDARESVEDQTALMWAVARRHADVVEVLLAHGADVTARSRVRRQVISRRLQSELRYGELGRRYGTDAEETRAGGFTPMLFAARVGDVRSARLLQAAGASVNDTAPDGASAILVATHSGHREAATWLLQHGANPNAAAVGYAPLHAAVLTGDATLVATLLEHGARPDAQVTLATRVTRNGQVLMLGEHLLGATPFALAAKFAEPEIMALLADAGADTVLPLKNGWTPLMLASGASWRYGVWDRRDRAVAKHPAFQAEHYDETRALAAVTRAVEGGADVDAVDARGSTALHHAVDKGFDAVVSYLVAQGAALDAVNARGQTPLAIVERGRSGNTDAAPRTAELLRSLSTSR